VIVNTNLSALNAQRMLFENTKAATTVMERLATGSKINKAQDDVAGSAIADRMTAQVRGLNMAVKNANDALSMLAVAESVGLDQTDILQRIRELTLQASSDTNSAQDIEFLQTEVSNLIGEFDRSSKTEFNGEVVSGLKTFQLGANSGQSLDLYFGTTSAYSGSVFGQATQDYNVGDSTIEVKGLSTVGPFAFADMVTINGQGYFVQGVGASPEINGDGTFTQTISITSGGGGLIEPITAGKELIAAFGTIDTTDPSNPEFRLGGRGSLWRLDLSGNASGALSKVDHVHKLLLDNQAKIGATQNRINYTISNLMNISEQTTIARSRIEDADFATESAALAKTQVLQQTATAMLAQANASPRLVLQLVK
jgi:flagellin